MGPQSSPASTFLLIALMVVAFYFLIIRPNKKRQQAQQKTMSSLTPGDRVLLTSGVFGTLVEVGEKQAVLELSPGVELTVLKGAIARQVLPEDEDFEYESDEDPSDGDVALADQPPAADSVNGNASGSSALSGPDFAVTDTDRPGTSNQPLKD
jgi:preprotein translocase subunit YajC